MADTPREILRLWRAADLMSPPAVHDREPRDDLTALYYDGLPWRGRETRVFALLGLPDRADDHAPAPGMVCVHGGGGTAFPDWVRHWTAQGFAALAMDCCGSMGGGTHGNHPRHAFGGPPGWGGFDQLDEPPGDQWMTHAVAAMVRGHSLLRSLPEVDADRVGLTGISWGGIQASIAGAVDPRLSFIIPVYGCGYLGEYDSGPGLLEACNDPGIAQRWKARWDPCHYLPLARGPFLWVNGTNDLAFSLPSLTLSSRLPRGDRTLSLRRGLAHGHVAGYEPKEITAFARHHARGEPALARITHQARDNHRLTVRWTAEVPVTAAELLHTTDRTPWRDRTWQSHPLPAAGREGTVEARLPAGTTSALVNLVDARGLVVSSDPVGIEDA